MLELFLVKEIKPTFPGRITFGKTFSKIFFHQQIHNKVFLLTAIWLPYWQLWAIIERTASPPAVNHYSLTILIKRSPRAL